MKDSKLSKYIGNTCPNPSVGAVVVKNDQIISRGWTQPGGTPHAEVIAHPECEQNILDHAHFIGSTTALIKHTQKSPKTQFIIVTEPGVIHQMEKLDSSKKYIPLANNEGCACNECPYMRLNTLDKMIEALETLSPEIKLNPNIMDKATPPLLKMLELSA